MGTLLLPSHTRTRLQSEWDASGTTLPTKNTGVYSTVGTRWDVPASVLMYALPLRGMQKPDASRCVIGEVRRVKRGWQWRRMSGTGLPWIPLYYYEQTASTNCPTLRKSHGRIWTQLCSHARILFSHPLDLAARTGQLSSTLGKLQMLSGNSPHANNDCARVSPARTGRKRKE